MNTDQKQLYKVLVNGKSCHGGDMTWSLPTKTKAGKPKPGQWMNVEGQIEFCVNGLHFTSEWTKWLKPGCTIYNAEAQGISAWDGDKCVARRGRLLSEAALPDWWACTQNAIANLANVAWLKPTNPKPEWQIFYGKNWAAARNAAWDAAWAAARNAARNAARDAARNAAWDAAWDAARNAALDAARNAARNAALDAARNAAWDAAWNAAWDAALDAALDAARDAANQIIINVLCADLPIDQKHRDAIAARWDVWQRGYGLLAEADGVLFVYAPSSSDAK